jgi:UPF0271 protein
MPFTSSANIACGYHAGDEDTMKRTVDLAIQYNVAIGAHPSFDDRDHFGRKEMDIEAGELYDIVTKQVHALQKVAAFSGVSLHHVKPHGALYNMAARDAAMSHAIARAVKDVDAGLVVYGLSNSHLIAEAGKLQLRTASEVFADRTYRDDGSLTPRSQANAMIEDEAQSLQQVMQMIEEQCVTSVTGKRVVLKAETICLHGDGVHAVTFAKKIYHALKEKGIAIRTHS